MHQHLETVVVGGGQAGLATSYCLSQMGAEHVVLERAEAAAHTWRAGRWDSFTLVTPNWTIRLPGARYAGPEPGGYMPRDEIVAMLEQYALGNRLPVSYGTEVSSVEPLQDGTGFSLDTSGGHIVADNVVIATGVFQQPRIPAYCEVLPPGVHQMHSGQYRNPGALPPGAVLVVGSGQSGAQIVDELLESGRKVYLSVGTAGRAPRRYRGRDIIEWLEMVGFFDRTPEMLQSPRERFAAVPHVSGRAGGKTLNLHQFARDGAILLGHIQAADDGLLILAADLSQRLAAADRFEAEITQRIDEYIRRRGLDVLEEQLPQLRDGYAAPVLETLDLTAAGINTIIWSSGYRFDYGLLKAPVLDDRGYPTAEKVEAYPGLHFAGLAWLPKFKHALFLGAEDGATQIAEAIAERRKGRRTSRA